MRDERRETRDNKQETNERQETGNGRWEKRYRVCSMHSWAQRKLSPLSPLNILLSINGPLLSLGFNRFNN